MRGFFIVMINALYQIFRQHPKICTDTRKIEKNSIFFALKGPSFNANALASKAIEQGCAYAVVDEKEYSENEKFILVDDALTALQDLAKYHRSELKKNNIPFIGITGSNGKTTTKELISAVLCRKYKSLATQGNLNNHIGVPLTVLSITPETEIAIIEMGANHIGEIALLCSIAQPEYGMITNIGKAHLEGFGSFEGVIKAKSEMYDYLRKNNGTAFLNNDNKLLKDLSEGIKKITYGKSADSDIHGKFIEADPLVKISWKRKQEAEFNETVHTKIIGSYNFENILAAVCIGNYFGIERKSISAAIENYIPSNNRSQILERGTNTIILDCYNANPVSMSAAISNFAQIKDGNKIAVLGDMLELGEYSRKEHENIVEILKSCSFNKTILVGHEFSKIKLPENFILFQKSDEARQYLREHKIEHAHILIKGSRSIKLETIAEVL